jgi:hypothetical protein
VNSFVLFAMLYDELEEIFFAGYPLFHEEPKFKPVILHSMVQWALDEIPFLLQNQTFKDSFHIFVREIYQYLLH